MRGGDVQWHKAAEMLLTDFRAGQLGRITLETPEKWPSGGARPLKQRPPARRPQMPNAPLRSSSAVAAAREGGTGGAQAGD